jgi:hypothetical protein
MPGLFDNSTHFIRFFNVLQEIDIQQLLKVVHHYFMSLGVDEIRRRGVESEQSLRMVKTMVHELCRLLVSHQHKWGY